MKPKPDAVVVGLTLTSTVHNVSKRVMKDFKAGLSQSPIYASDGVAFEDVVNYINTHSQLTVSICDMHMHKDGQSVVWITPIGVKVSC